MIKSKLFAAAALMGVSIGAAHAFPVTFTDLWNPADVKLTEGQSISHEHNIASDSDNYNPLTDSITSAELTFWLYDDGDNDEGYIDWWEWEYVPGQDEGFKFIYDGEGWSSEREVNGTSGSMNVFDFDLDWNDLDEVLDGKLNFTLKSSDGDFYFAKSELEVKANRRVASVPEPTTLALLSLGLLGVGAAARRRRA